MPVVGPCIEKKNTQLWKIYKWVDEHNCYGTVVRNNNRSLRSKVVATHISHFIKQDVAYPVKHVQAHIKDVLHVDVSYQKAWHGRRKAIEGIYGSWESNFEELPRYIAALMQSNPNTVVQWKHHESGSSHGATFKYVFWAFGPSIEAFKLCHPVVCMDGTHLKGSYKGKLLTAVTKDANNHVLPVAFAIVDGETNESWSWFLEQFRFFVTTNSTRSLCVISDRHAGIVNAMQTSEYWKEPLAYHRFCLRHVRSNLMSHFKMYPLKRLCWALGSTTQRRKYVQSLREMKRIKPEAWDYLKSIRTSKWTLLHDTHNRRWGNLTTNIAESMNNSLKVARLLPIQACIDHTFNKTVEHFRKNSETAMNCSTPLPPRMWRLYVIRERHAQEHTISEFNYIEQVYRVVSRLTTNETGGNDYTVQYKDSTCTCGKWQITRFPCSHAIAVCRHRGDNIHAIVNRVYRTRTYQQQYRSDFSPLPHKAYWQDPGWTIRADSSRITNARGRRRARRMRNEMDTHYPEETRVRRCTICKQSGHTRTTCPNTQPSYD